MDSLSNSNLTDGIVVHHCSKEHIGLPIKYCFEVYTPKERYCGLDHPQAPKSYPPPETEEKLMRIFDSILVSRINTVGTDIAYGRRKDSDKAFVIGQYEKIVDELKSSKLQIRITFDEEIDDVKELFILPTGFIIGFSQYDLVNWHKEYYYYGKFEFEAVKYKDSLVFACDGKIFQLSEGYHDFFSCFSIRKVQTGNSAMLCQAMDLLVWNGYEHVSTFDLDQL